MLKLKGLEDKKTKNTNQAGSDVMTKGAKKTTTTVNAMKAVKLTKEQQRANKLVEEIEKNAFNNWLLNLLEEHAELNAKFGELTAKVADLKWTVEALYEMAEENGADVSFFSEMLFKGGVYVDDAPMGAPVQ